ncbi:hypothetical protein RUM43_010643 [Polyplax serrata]|uniref:Uncharacterized protein n=1 Tax=Polyplax serrata TaxID=468196 RepID=A0AAN8PW03_POLSC
MRSPRRSSGVGNTKTDGHEVAQPERNRTDLGATLTDGKITAPEIGHGLLEKFGDFHKKERRLVDGAVRSLPRFIRVVVSRDKVRWTQVAFVSFRSILTDLDEFKTGLGRVSRSLIQSEPNKKSGVQLTRGKNKWFATVQPETLKKKCPRPAFCVAWTSMWSLKRVRAHYPKPRRVRSCL